MTEKFWWYISLVISLILVGFIYFIWQHEVRHYEPAQDQLVNNSTVETYLENHTTVENSQIRIPTGIFIQSLKFVNASDANITGYIWQEYSDDVPEDISRGVIFPEQVSSSSTVNNEGYRRKNGNAEVIGWYFDVTLRQPFDYSNYPLDKQKVWIRMWHKDFDRNVILTPDLDAYDSTRYQDTFGLDPDIVPGGWTILETFFQYQDGRYDTNFGIDNYVGKNGFPELHFNIVVGRDFKNAFIINLVPLIIVASMLFSVLMTTTSDKTRIEKFGFSVSGALSTAAALFFVVMLAHIQVREQFPGAGIVYIEQFYLTIYAVILLLSLNVYFFAVDYRCKALNFMHYQDNFISKVIFWPMILFIIASISLVYF